MVAHFNYYAWIDPVALRLGPIAIRWYGIAYLTGFILAYLLLRWMIRRKWLLLTYDGLVDLLGWLVAGVLVGGRTGWWLFYHRGPIEHWWEPAAIWTGGMSFHGGLAGVVLALLLWTRIRRVPFWNVADCLAIATPIGLLLGRIANFINHELVGRPTSVPWAIVFPDYPNQPRHPSQLYEAFLEGPLLFLVLWIARRWFTPGRGKLAGLFVTLYGVFRFAVEFTREPDKQLGFIFGGWLTMGQILSLAQVLVGIVMMIAVNPPPPVAPVEPPAKDPSKKRKG